MECVRGDKMPTDEEQIEVLEAEIAILNLKLRIKTLEKTKAELETQLAK